jgi:hypothetical protein
MSYFHILMKFAAATAVAFAIGAAGAPANAALTVNADQGSAWGGGVGDDSVAPEAGIEFF